MGGREETGDVVGLRSVVGFLLHPTWRDKGGKKQTRGRRQGEKHKQRQTAAQKETKRGRDTGKDTERRRPREPGREKSCKEGGETMQEGGRWGETESEVSISHTVLSRLPFQLPRPVPPASPLYPVSPSPPGFLRRMSLRISS